MRVQIIEEQLPNVLNFICEHKKKGNSFRSG